MTIEDLRLEWRRLAGARIAALTAPSDVDGQTLVVTVPASVFTHQLEAESAAILARLGLVDGIRITGIEWRQVAPKPPIPRRRHPTRGRR